MADRCNHLRIDDYREAPKSDGDGVYHDSVHCAGCGEWLTRLTRERPSHQRMTFLREPTPSLAGTAETMTEIRQRFDAKWTPEPNTGCWLWVASLDVHGYGTFHSPLVRGKKAHRHSWVLHRGPIPEGMHLDHMCRVRSCVNPDHLRVVTPRQNVTENSLSQVARNTQKTHCVHGHEFTPENTSIYMGRGLPHRRCRACIEAETIRRWDGSRRAARQARLDAARPHATPEGQ